VSPFSVSPVRCEWTSRPWFAGPCALVPTGAFLLGLAGSACLRAQVEREYFARTPPYPVYQAPETARYNLKLGSLTARLSGNVQFEFSDNINLSDKNPRADLSIGPYAGLGFLWPVTRNHVLQLDLGIGYRWYLNSPDVSSIHIDPNTHLDYTIYIDDVRVTFRDRFSIQVDPVSRPELNGATRNVTKFRRLNNISGLAVDWQATKDWELFGGYDFTVDRSLTSDFKDIDREEHTWYAGVNYAVTPRVKVGVLGSYSITDYTQHVQNGAHSYSVGPTLVVKINKYLMATASVAYTVSEFDRTGSILDGSNFEGPTYQLGLQQVLTPRTSHHLRFAQALGLGIGSNFSETTLVQYGINTMLSKNVSLNGIMAYEHLSVSSGAGSESDRYLLYLGSGYQFSREWSAGVSYSFSFRDAVTPGFSYVQNRLTLDLTRRF